jgi:hypothetical protein
LEIYYAAFCEPCRQELPILAKLEHGTNFVIVVLGDRDKGRSQVLATSPAFADKIRIPPAGDDREMLRKAGDRDGILPYARTIRQNGSLCASWRGILTEVRIQTMIKTCSE